MIIKGNSRSSVAFWAGHLMRVDHNERAEVVDVRGLGSRDVRECLAQLELMAAGTRARNGFYVASLNPRDDEQLTPEQWERAQVIAEAELGLEGQPCFVVEHEKDGRTHRHIVWSRIDADTHTAIRMDFNYQKHERAARAIEAELGLEPVESVLVKDRESERPERRPADWEGFRAVDTKIDPQAMKAELTALYEQADSGLAFKAALEDAGYILARGDRRDFVVIDPAADDHSLARRISGAKAAEIRARLSDIDREGLPSVADAREQMRARAEADSSSARELPAAEPEAGQADASPFHRDNYEPVSSFSRADYEDAPRPNWEALESGDETGGRVTPWGRAWSALTERVRNYQTWIAERWEEAKAANRAPDEETWVDYVTRTGATVARVAGELWQERIKPGLGPLGRMLADEGGAGDSPFAELEKRAARWLTDEEPDENAAGGASLSGEPETPGPAEPESPGAPEPDEPDVE